MKNQDKPAIPTEAKHEKAFWQVYSAMLIDPNHETCDYDLVADSALEAVSAGFKALERDG